LFFPSGPPRTIIVNHSSHLPAETSDETSASSLTGTSCPALANVVACPGRGRPGRPCRRCGPVLLAVAEAARPAGVPAATYLGQPVFESLLRGAIHRQRPLSGLPSWPT